MDMGADNLLEKIVDIINDQGPMVAKYFLDKCGTRETLYELFTVAIQKNKPVALGFLRPYVPEICSSAMEDDREESPGGDCLKNIATQCFLHTIILAGMIQAIGKPEIQNVLLTEYALPPLDQIKNTN